MMLEGETPELTSASIRDKMYSAATLIPASSSGPLGLRVFRSNHEGIWKPELRVTGILLALGQMSFTPAGVTEERVFAQPWPVSLRVVNTDYNDNMREITILPKSVQEDDRGRVLSSPRVIVMRR